MEELKGIQRYLMEQDEGRKPQNRILAEVDIQINPSRLVVTYYTSQVGIRNIEDRVNRLGYAVNALEGNPDRRAVFRGNHLTR